MRFIFLVTIIVTTYSMVALGETDTIKTKPDLKVLKKKEVVKKAVTEKKAETEKPAEEKKTAKEKIGVEEKKEEQKAKTIQEKKAVTKKAKKPVKPVEKTETKAEKQTKESKAVTKPAKPAKKTDKKASKEPDKPAKKTEATVKVAKEEKLAREKTQKAKASEIQIARAVICKDVVKHEPQGSAEKFAKDSKRLYCFSHIKGVKDSLTIQHKWYYKNKEIGFSNLAVKSSDWRTYSYRDIEEDQKGDWNVKIVNSENGEVLKTLKFSVE